MMSCPPTMKMKHTSMRTPWPRSHLSLEIRGGSFLMMKQTRSTVRRYKQKGPPPTGFFKFPIATRESARRVQENVFLCMSSRLKRRVCVCPSTISKWGFSVASIGALSTSPKCAGVHAGVRACLSVSTNRGHAAPLLLYLSPSKTIHWRRASVGVL